MPNLESVKRDILVECEEDHVGLWSVIREVEDAFPDSDTADIRNRVLQLVHELLAAHMIQAGFPSPGGRGFRPLRMAPDQIVHRIEEEWPVDRRPKIGEGVWFTRAKKANHR